MQFIHGHKLLLNEYVAMVFINMVRAEKRKCFFLIFNTRTFQSTCIVKSS